MKILALETSSPYSGIAILRGKEPILSLINHKPFHHVEELPLFVEKALSFANLTLKDLSFIAISKGPGFFTGLRAGISYARALAYSLDIPLLTVPTMEVIQREYKLKDAEICFRLKGDKVFYQRFENNKPQKEPVILNLNEIEQKYPLIIKEDAILPYLVGIIAYEKYIEGNEKIEDIENIEPLYVQAPYVRKSEKGKKV